MLDEYKKKRNFKASPEPNGNNNLNKENFTASGDANISIDDHNQSKSRPRFVIQKHEATRLHYDFRLESIKEDVLLSWAIPKGPSLDPSIKRLAIQTEDHPVDYLSFEGVIPEGNYGAGTVIVWDIGEYSLEKSSLTKYPTKEHLEEIPEVLDVSELEKKYGKITFVLYGQKLKGKFSLLKTRTKNQWLLIKLKDDFARGSNNSDKSGEKDITESRPESVLTGKKNRDLMQYKSSKTLKKDVKADNSIIKYSAEIPENPNTLDTLGDHNLDTINLSSANRSLKQMCFEGIKPMLPSLADKPFNNKDWIFEIKWDGVRAITLVDRLTKTCTIKSRRGDTITQRYPELENTFNSALKEDMFKDFVILDGEIVILDNNGYPDFQNHQKRMNIDSIKSIEILSDLYPAVYYVFDILYLDNNNLMQLPFAERRKILVNLVKKENSKIRISDFVEEFGIDVFETIRKMSLEGIIGKHRNSKYHSGIRTRDWLKIKNIKTQDCLVIGYTRGEGNRKNYFGSLLLAAIDNTQNNIHTNTNNNVNSKNNTSKLRFIGHTGSGFSFESLSLIHKKLREIEIPYCPVDNIPYLNRETVWVRPITVIEVKFNNWTSNKIMRAPIFLRIREDKPPHQCVIEISSLTNSPKFADTIKKDEDGNDIKITNNKNGDPITDLDQQFSNLKKEFWSATEYRPAITKGDLMDYYGKISELLLPYLRDRPISLSRYPDGIYGKAFYQKDWKNKKPHYVRTVKVYSESNNDEINYIVCNNKETLLWLVNLGCIEIHPWNSRVNDYNQCNKMDVIETEECGLNYPDFIVFDLDPYINIDNENESKEPAYSLAAFRTTVEIALRLEGIFDELNIKSYVKTSGKTGLHIFVPVINMYTYKQTREFARVISQILNKRNPGQITTEWKTTDRKGKVFLDYNQNSIGKTLASVFSTRPVEDATVSVPLTWEELVDIIPTDFTLKTVPDLYKRKIDPWKDILSHKQNLEEILERISDFKV